MADLTTYFPWEVATVQHERMKLKIHHIDLANVIKDVELLASSTKSGLNRGKRKLELRARKFPEGKAYNPSWDKKLWRYEIKTQIADLDRSLDKCELIKIVLKHLQEDCIRTADNLEMALNTMKTKLKNKISTHQSNLKILQVAYDKNNSCSCSFWGWLFSGGSCCNAEKAEADRIKKEMAFVKKELWILQKLEAQWHYFDNIVKYARTLAQVAGDLLDITKEFA